MDKFLKSIKFVNLLEQNCSCYLSACEDKKTVTLVRKHDSGVVPKGAEWRVKWVKGPTGDFTGKCRLHSIYKKVLVVSREGEGSRLLRVHQDRFPEPHGTDAVAEWSLSMNQLTFEGHEVEAQLAVVYDQVSYFLAGPKIMMCNYERFASPELEPLKSACKLRVHNWILHQLFNTEQQQQKRKQKEDAKKQNSTTTANTDHTSLTTTATNSITKSKAEVAVGRTTAVASNGQVSQQLAGWQVGQVVLNYYNPGGGGGGGVGGGFSRYIPAKMLMAPAHKLMGMSTCILNSVSPKAFMSTLPATNPDHF